MRRIGIIGYGAIGRRAATLVAASGRAEVAGVLLRPGSEARPRDEAEGLVVVDSLEDLLALGPTLVAECAGQAALAAEGARVLAAGVDLVAASVGALADPTCEAALRAAAAGPGAGALILPAGAIGGLDALAAMRLAGLDRVTYAGRKPLAAWRGTTAEALVAAGAGGRPVVVFEGDARAAARAFPQNANVAATIALAGAGFAATRVRLLADPSVVRNVHEIEAEGATGRLTLRFEGLPDPENPKTSALTAASVAAVASGLTGGLMPW
jgi:aspartate dehydrogenase